MRRVTRWLSYILAFAVAVILVRTVFTERMTAGTKWTEAQCLSAISKGATNVPPECKQ